MAVKFFDADHRRGLRMARPGSTLPSSTRRHHQSELGPRHRLPGLERAIQEACDAGALVVIAAGNSGTNNDVIPTIPACYRKSPERIITVMATDRYDEKASFSNYGVRTVDLAAPGVGLVTTRAALAGVSGIGDRPTPPVQRDLGRRRNGHGRGGAAQVSLPEPNRGGSQGAI